MTTTTTTKVIRCDFCNSVLDPNNPDKDRCLQLSKRDLEEIRRYMAYHLNKDGMFNNNDNPRGLINVERISDVYKELTRFLMK